MAKGEHAGEAQQKIHRHGREPKHENTRAERGIAPKRYHPVGCQQQHQPNRGQCHRLPCLCAAHVIMPSSPNKPRGRMSSTTAISTYMMASLAAGRNTAVMPEATPMSSPPSSVPVRLPTPPTMMAMKLGINRPVPIVGSRPSCPAARTPLKPARKNPTAKLRERPRPPLIPP